MQRDLYRMIQEYCASQSSAPDEVLTEIERRTHLETVTPQMIAGSYQGLLLEMLSRMIQPTQILEIGTFTGYAAVCLARGLAPGGRLTTIEVDPEREPQIRQSIQQAGLADKVDLVIGDAMHIVPSLNEVFDLVFIDAGKRDYPAYFDMAVDKTRTGGYILLDNVLWGGKVVTDPDDNDAAVIHQLNTRIAGDPALRCIMLPVRDGMTIVEKC